MRANCSSVLVSKQSRRDEVGISQQTSTTLVDDSPLKPAIQARKGSMAAQIRLFDDGHGVHLREANNRQELMEFGK